MVHPIDRRTLLSGLGVAGAAALAGQHPASATPPSPPNPLDLRFTTTHQHRPFALIAPGFVQYDTAVAPPAARDSLVVTDHGPRAPYGTVEVEVGSLSGTVLAGLAGDGVSVLGAYADGQASIEVTVEGTTTTVAAAAAGLTAPFRFAVVVNENAVTVLAETGAGWQPLLSARAEVRALIDLRDPRVLGRLGYAYGGRDSVTLGRVRAGYYGQAGVRDPHVVQHADGRPLIRDGKLYLTLTNAGLGFFQQAHWGVWTVDLADPAKLEQVANLFFARDDVVLGDHAGQIVLDGDRFILANSSWGDFDGSGVHIRHLTTTADVLSGVHVLASEPLPLPTSVSSWDPALTRIDGRWHVAFVESPTQQPSFVFHPALAAGPRGAAHDDGLELVGADLSVGQTEGTIIQRFGSRWYVLASDGDAREYPVYDLGMRLLGTLDAPYGTNIPHPMIVPYRGGWRLLTFDGTQFAEPVLGYGGHGDFIVQSAR
ncbi:glycoside hydrolase family protein [Actinophytocola sediminis]